MLVRVLISALALLQQSPGALSTGAPAQPAPTPCSTPSHRHFDFLVGHWEVSNSEKLLGVNRVERIDGGCALLESWQGAGGGSGHSLNRVGFDGRWRQTWVDASGQSLELAGGWTEDRMLLSSEGPGPRHRISWTPQADGTVRQVWETSADGGVTHHVVFDGTYRRVEPTVSPGADRLGDLAGEWIGSGQIMGAKLSVQLTIRPIVGAGLYSLEWRNLGNAASPAFEGRAIYETADAAGYTGRWWDSRGGRFDIKAKVEGTILRSFWGDRGRTEYQFLGSGEIEVTDALKSADGSWREFGRSRLKRRR